MTEYSEVFKAKMVQKMAGPSGMTATALARKVGVPQSTLSIWLRKARAAGTMTDAMASEPKAKGPRSPEEKLRIVNAAHDLHHDALGAFLRREGVHEAELEEWRRQALEGLQAPAAPPVRRGDSRRVRQLERELRRKDKALAEAAALIVLSKKAEALWADEDDGTDEENEK